MNINNEAIKIAKTLLGINNAFEDSLLSVLGTIAENDALLISRNEKALFDENLLAQMIQIIYQKRGSENVASFSAATVSETYIENYPKNILNALQSYRKLIAL